MTVAYARRSDAGWRQRRGLERHGSVGLPRRAAGVAMSVGVDLGAPLRARDQQRKIIACSLFREPDRGADTGLENGVGLGAVGGGTRELQRPGEEPQECRCVGAGHLAASTR